MMGDDDIGGDPPCWAHLFDAGDDTANHGLVVDLGAETAGPGGAVWSLPHGGDLDANLVRLDGGATIDAHVNNEVDVLFFVQSGSAYLTIDGQAHLLGAAHLAMIPKGSLRSIRAATTGITYLSVHRRRSPLGITKRPTKEPVDES